MFGNTRKRLKKRGVGKTAVTFLLDRTGSMEAVKDDTIGAFNAYLDTLQKSGEEIDFTLIQFDSCSVDKLHVRTPVHDVPRLTTETFIPRDLTPLIDAAVKTIRAVEASLKDHPAEKVVICILTDGVENASKEHNWSELSALVKEKREAGWQFNFMGAGFDAYDQSHRMGLTRGETVSYGLGPQSTAAAFSATAANTVLYSRGARGSTVYAENQKQAAGDEYDRPRTTAVDDFKL